MAYVTNTELQALVAAQAERITAQDSRIDALERLLNRVAGRMGMSAQPDVPATPSPVVTNIASDGAIERFRSEMMAHANAGRSWDMAVDLVSRELFIAAQREFSLTIGKGNGTRSVAGFRAYIMGGTSPREQAA